MIKKIEISNFTLEYDGIYHLYFGDRLQMITVYLPIDQLFTIFQKEGYNFEDAMKLGKERIKIPFKKVVLLFNVVEKKEDDKLNYTTPEFSQVVINHNLTFFEFEIKE